MTAVTTVVRPPFANGPKTNGPMAPACLRDRHHASRSDEELGSKILPSSLPPVGAFCVVDHLYS